MTIIWIIIFTLTPAGVSAGTTVTGHRGQSVQIRCSYSSLSVTSIKFLCRGECPPWGPKDIPVQSGYAEDQRFPLDDDTAARVFTITITDLRAEDEGTYWCVVTGPQALLDDYTEILLLVKTDAPLHSTYSPPSVQTQSTPPASSPSTGSSADSVLVHSTPSFPISTYVNSRPTQLSPSPDTSFMILYVCVSLLVSGIALGVLVLFCNWRKRQDVQSSIITQRNSRRDVDVTDYENDAPGNQQFMTVYQSLNPSTNQSCSVFRTSITRVMNSNSSLSLMLMQQLPPPPRALQNLQSPVPLCSTSYCLL
ncbi:hypothetical protein SRHO_G00179150 [Serrasalmus rhombeus]